MAITFPYDILATFPGWSVEFDLLWRQEQSRTAGGQTIVKDMGSPLWQATYQSRSMRPNELDSWRARFKLLENGLNQFYGRPTSRCYPIAYPNGSWPGNVVGQTTRSGNFVTGVYTKDGAASTLTGVSSLVRASTKYALNTAGVFTAFANNVMATTPLGALVETAVLNRFEQSNTFSNAAWGKTRGSVTSSTITAPDGTATASSFVEDTTATNTHLISQSETNQAVAGLQSWLSIFVKKMPSGRQFVQVWTSNFAGQTDRSSIVINLDTGAVSSVTGVNPSYLVESVGSGWYRVSLRATASGTATYGLTVSLQSDATTGSYTGDGVSGVYLWNGQFENGTKATSPIITTTAVTRPADALTLLGTGINNWTMTFDDNSTQTFSGVSGNLVIDPATISRPYIKSFSAVLATAATTLDGVQVNSINANRKAVSLKNLPVGYTGKVGDYIQIGAGDLHQVMEDFTANGSGITPQFEIRAHLWPLAAVNQAVKVVQPACPMTLVPGSLSTTTELATGRGIVTFQAMESR